MIDTKVAFYYGHTIHQSNLYLDFKEGAGPELTATIDIGEYSLTDFCLAISSAMNIAGSLDYTVSVNRLNRIITISSSGSFQLLASTGSHATQSPFSLIGFSSDTSLATSHTGTFASGYSWRPQFYPMEYVDFLDNVELINGTLKESTNGKVEAVSFGKNYFMECNFIYITNIVQSSHYIDSDINGVSNARSFLDYAITKADMEFIPDVTKTEFTKCILESTAESKDGFSYKLKELYGKNLVGYFETGNLKFRKVL